MYLIKAILAFKFGIYYMVVNGGGPRGGVSLRFPKIPPSSQTESLGFPSYPPWTPPGPLRTLLASIAPTFSTW